MRALAILAVLFAGCSGSTETDTRGLDAGVDVATEAAVEAAPDVGPDSEQDLKACIWKAQWCHNPGDCVTAVHTVDCCGTLQVIGVNQANMASFDACEQAWQDTLPDCACGAKPTTTESGSAEVTDMSQVDARCTNFTSEGGICQSFVVQ
jgi:hypothetical protein